MLGWFSLMLDASRWSAADARRRRAEFALYKTALRPLIRTADLYHVSARPDGVHWDGIEYYSPAEGRGVLYAFRGSSSDEPSHRFRLGGLPAGGRYALHFQEPGRDREESAETLTQEGVEVALATPLSSQLVFFKRLHPRDIRDASAGPNSR